MANVLLITPTNKMGAEFQNWGSPHLGVWRIAGYVRKYGHHVQVWDTILSTESPKGDWDIVGMSLTHNTLPEDIKLMNSISKLYPHATLIAGGIEASTNYQQILEKTKASYIVIGEGEKPVLALAYIRDGIGTPCHTVPGCISRVYQEITLHDLEEFSFAIPFSEMNYPAYWDITGHLRENLSDEERCCVRLNTTTFCDRACKFCSTTHIHRMATGAICKPITLDGESTKELVRRVQADVPEVKTIYFNDDDFTLYREKVETFFDQPPPLRYLIQARVDTVDLPLLRHIAQGGCKHISFGVESCSQRVIDEMGKGIRIEQVEDVIRWCKEVGIFPNILIILFAPTMTMDDLKLNYTILSDWERRGIGLSIMSYIRPYHGTYYLNSSLYDVEWTKINGIKQPKALLPMDPDVRALWYKFEKELAIQERALSHRFKGATSGLMVEILGELLQEQGVL